MEIFGETIERELPDLAEAGRAHALHRAAATARPTGCASRWRRSRPRPPRTTGSSLWIAFDYGGRAELVEAARRLLDDGRRAGRARRGRRSPRTCTRPSCRIPTS